MATLRLIVDLTTGQGSSFDAEVARIKANVDNGASGQTFKTLGVGVITYTVPDVAKFPLAYSTVGNLGELIPARDFFSVPGLGPIPKSFPDSPLWGPLTGFPESSRSLDRIIDLSGGPPVVPENWEWEVTGLEHALNVFTGQGVKVGVIDSGAAGAHPALAGRIAKFAKVRRKNDGPIGVATPADEATDPQGHGTQVTSILAGVDPDGGRLGVAPGCTVCVADITRDGVLAWEDVQFITALEWMAEQGVRVLNLSVVYPLSRLEGHDIVLAAARRAGMLPIVAIGNHGCGVTATPGNSPQALSVGAMDGPKTVAPDSGCRRASSSTSRALPRLLAPGRVRVALKSGGIVQWENTQTSFAAPFVSGIAALLLEACPAATNAQLEQALLTSAARLQRTDFCNCPPTPVVNFESALGMLRALGLETSEG